jgi:NMD protein affecting ribosome stability and mRNA decay
VTDDDKPVVNNCVQCGAGIGDATGLCAACAIMEADNAQLPHGNGQREGS